MVVSSAVARRVEGCEIEVRRSMSVEKAEVVAAPLVSCGVLERVERRVFAVDEMREMRLEGGWSRLFSSSLVSVGGGDEDQNFGHGILTLLDTRDPRSGRSCEAEDRDERWLDLKINVRSIVYIGVGLNLPELCRLAIPLYST